MEYKTCFKYFLLIAVCSVLLYSVLSDKHTILLNSIHIPYITLHSIANESIEVNESNQNQTSFSSSQPFVTRLSDHYPHLPIHIYTQDLSTIGNTSKLILLGNGFFGDRHWSVAPPGKSSTEITKSLYCPMLANRCDMTTDYNRFAEADAVVYHMRDGIDRNMIKGRRHSKQRFVFALWESPAHTPNVESYNHFFNWTMTYRWKSDVITSYYSGNAYLHTASNYYRLMLEQNATKKLNLKSIQRTHRPSDEILQKKKLGTVAALITNCGGRSDRLKFITELRRYIDVKIYGRCGEACPANTDCRSFIGENYYYLLSFENSLCSEYTTEKFFATLEHPIVPVVLGRTNYSYLIPSSAFIDTREFTTMSSLAQFLNNTRNDKEKYLSYFSWKKDYVWGLSDFFTPFCDLCVRLHLDSEPKIIENIQKWWFDDACVNPQPPK